MSKSGYPNTSSSYYYYCYLEATVIHTLYHEGRIAPGPEIHIEGTTGRQPATLEGWDIERERAVIWCQCPSCLIPWNLVTFGSWIPQNFYFRTVTVKTNDTTRINLAYF